MKSPFDTTKLLAAALVFLSLELTGFGAERPAPATRGYAATVHPLATDAALAAFRDGGNAVDAAIAAGLTLGVVDGHNSGIGGGCFLLIRRASGELIAIDGRETAPAAAHRDLFIREGKAVPELSQTGALAVGVPGALAAYEYAGTHCGNLPLRALLLPAAALAERGFPIDSHYAQRLAATAAELRRFDASRAIFLNRDGQPLRAGEPLRQIDLARTYRSIAEQGTGWFYRGRFAERVADWMKQNGGLITAEDFQSYRVKVREPVRTTYRGCEVIGFPPPSSGGVHVAQILNILGHFDLKAMGAGSPDFVHTIAEAMKLAFVDRAFWLGDPDFASVPRGLTAMQYGEALARRIHPRQVTAVANHGTPPDSATDVFRKHTTHFSTADAEGNWVAGTATINTSFGSKVVVPGTGVLLNNQMDDFSAQPGAVNFFGLVGAEANAVAPGKRPLSSMSPTLVLRTGKPFLALGAAGGPTIISQVVLAVVHSIDFGMDPGQALAQPRFHHQWKPDELVVERSMPDAVIRGLEKRGHQVRRVDSIGAAQVVGLDAVVGGFTGASDPRVHGKAAGW